MSTLIYTEMDVRADDVEQHLTSVDRTSAVRVIVPVRPLTTDEEKFVAVEFDDNDAVERDVRFARWRLDAVMDALRSAGHTDVDGQTSADSAVDTIEHAVEDGNVDHVVVITGPTGVAGWIQMDLPHRIERHVDRPVTHVELDRAHA
ncbi:MAG: hypothetical protein HKN44_14925 [Ilumatobacter sp.]|nr:hypothetical protein [Ilumatobacter sp.]